MVRAFLRLKFRAASHETAEVRFVTRLEIDFDIKLRRTGLSDTLSTGGRSLVRPAKTGRAGGKSGHRKAIRRVECAGAEDESPPRRKVSQKTNRRRFDGPSEGEDKTPSGVVKSAARVKRRGKSPPPREQSRGHDKPRMVQDRTEERVACPAVRRFGEGRDLGY